MPKKPLPPIAFAITGPTASGKTALSAELAKHHDVEIISVDSALVYRDMNVGTAKPDAAFRNQVPHHLIDIISPLESYSAARFRDDAIQLMQEIYNRGKLPLLVGGTMLYIRALKEGLHELPSANPDVRRQIELEAEQKGWPEIHNQLNAVDPKTASRLKPTDSQRIQRALEIYKVSGRTMSDWLSEPPAVDPLPLPLKTIALMPNDRARLHDAIHHRFDEMIENGLIEEVQSLKAKYPELHLGLPAMRCVGYRQVWEYLADKIPLETMRQKGYAATRQLCKHQLTWMRQMTFDCTIDPFTPTAIHDGINYVETSLKEK